MAEEFARKDTVERAFKRIEAMESNLIGIRDQQAILREQQAITSTLVETLKQLPVCFSELQATLVEVSAKLQSVESKVDSTNEKVEKIETNLKGEIKEIRTRASTLDDKGKIDIVVWIKNKWFEIVVGLITLSMVIKDLSK